MLSIAAARLLLCCQAFWPCERLCILICLSTAVSEPRGYAWSSHSHIVGCPRCDFKQLYLLLSPCCLSLSAVVLQLLWQTLVYPAGDALMLLPVACLVFVLFHTVLSMSRAQDLCRPVVFSFGSVSLGLFSPPHILLLASLGIKGWTFEVAGYLSI